MAVSQKEKITRYTGVVSVATLISRILGFARDMVIALLFGAHGSTDSFFVAFGVPNLLRGLFAEGGLSAAFVPVYSEYINNDSSEEAKRFADSTFTLLVIVLAVVSMAGIFMAPWFIRILVPGFGSLPGKVQLTVSLTQVLFPFIFFIGLASLATGILNTKGHFFWPALSPAFLNVGMISCAVLFYLRFGVPIFALAAGALLGGALQFAVQVPSMVSRGVAPRFSLNLRHPGMGKVMKLMMPALLGLGVDQINALVDRWIASWLPEGSVSYLYYANRLVQFPLGVFGIAIAMAILPVLAEHAARKEIDELKASFLFGTKLTIFIMVPSAAGLMVLKAPIVNILFQRGAFSPEAALGTSTALFYYSIGLFAYAGAKVAASGFYSLQDTKTPFIIGVYALIINVVFNLLLMGPMKHNGLALATSISSIFNFLALLILWFKRVGDEGGAREVARSALRSLLASAVLGLVAWLLYRGMFHAASPLLIKVGVLVVCMAAGGVVYFVINRLWMSEELVQLLKLLRRA